MTLPLRTPTQNPSVGLSATMPLPILKPRPPQTRMGIEAHKAANPSLYEMSPEDIAQHKADHPALYGGGIEYKNGSAQFTPPEPTPTQVTPLPTPTVNASNPSSNPQLTSLSPDEHSKMQDWAIHNKVPSDVSANSDYDMNGYFKKNVLNVPSLADMAKGSSSGVSANDGQMHFTDEFKTTSHPTQSAESKYAPAGAPNWNEQDQLVKPNGQIVIDERANADPSRGMISDLKAPLTGDLNNNPSPSLESVENDKSNRLMAASAAGASIGGPLMQYGINNLQRSINDRQATTTDVPFNEQAGAALDIDPYTGQVKKGPIDLLGKFRPAVSKIGAAASELGKGLAVGEALQTAKRGLYNATPKSTFGNVVTAGGLGLLGDNEAAKKALFGQPIDNLSPLARGAKDLLNPATDTPTGQESSFKADLNTGSGLPKPDLNKAITPDFETQIDPNAVAVASRAPVAGLPVPSARTQNGNDDTMTFPGGSLTMHNGTGASKLMGVKGYKNSTPESLAQLDKTMAYTKSDEGKAMFAREASIVNDRINTRKAAEAQEAQAQADKVQADEMAQLKDLAINGGGKQATRAAEMYNQMYQAGATRASSQAAQANADRTYGHMLSQDAYTRMKDERANTNHLNETGFNQAEKVNADGRANESARLAREKHVDDSFMDMVKQKDPSFSAQDLANIKLLHTKARDSIGEAGYQSDYGQMSVPDQMAVYEAYQSAKNAGGNQSWWTTPIFEDAQTRESKQLQAFRKHFADRRLTATQ